MRQSHAANEETSFRIWKRKPVWHPRRFDRMVNSQPPSLPFAAAFLMPWAALPLLLAAAILERGFSSNPSTPPRCRATSASPIFPRPPDTSGLIDPRAKPEYDPAVFIGQVSVTHRRVSQLIDGGGALRVSIRISVVTHFLTSLPSGKPVSRNGMRKPLKMSINFDRLLPPCRSQPISIFCH